MTFLPIVDRELRVRARQRSTFHLRLVGAAAASALVGFMLLVSGVVIRSAGLGQWVFHSLAWLTFIGCLLEGARNTADCLSEEKRAGTLGLLFLTDLKGYDVVLGKLAATSLNSLYSLIAIFPPLALPLLLGGVTSGEFWRLVLVLLNALFFSLTTGLLVSALSRSRRKAWGASFASIGLFTILVPCLQANALLPAPLLSLLSPSTTFLALFDSAYTAAPARFWLSLCTVHALGWVFGISASVIVPRAWQDRAENAVDSPPTPLRSRWSFSNPVKRQKSKERQLTRNPILWLASRGDRQSFYLWTTVLVAGGLLAMSWFAGAGSGRNLLALAGGAFALHFALAVWAASQACYYFVEARESGALELLLCTPLSVDQIVDGHLSALRDLFGRPVIALIGIEFCIVAGEYSYFRNDDALPLSPFLAVACFAVLVTLLVLDLHAVASFGMWMGLSSRKPGQAFARTVLYVLVAPWLMLIFCSLFGPVLLLVKNVICIRYARDHLRRNFRSVIAEPYLSSTAGTLQPLQAARRQPLPPVITG